MPAPTATFDEIRAVAASMPEADPAIAEETRLRLDRIAGAEGRTGALGDCALWLAAAQRQAAPRLQHPRIALFAATHGIAADVAGGTAEALGSWVTTLVDGSGVLHRLAQAADADLRLYELALDRPTRDSRAGSAMDEAETARAVAYGMMAVEPGVDLITVSAPGIGAEIAAASLGLAMFGGDRSGWLPAHAGAIAAAAERHGGARDPLALLAGLGGPDIAAMLGVILAARFASVPVILDGAGALAAGAVAQRLRSGGADHCRAAAADPVRPAGFVPEAGIEALLQFAIDPPLAGAAALHLAKGAQILLA